VGEQLTNNTIEQLLDACEEKKGTITRTMYDYLYNFPLLFYDLEQKKIKEILPSISKI